MSVSGKPEETPICFENPEQGQLFANQQFFQELVHQGSYYKDDQDVQLCNYTLTTGSQDTHVQLTFHMFVVQNSWGCERESVTIYDSNGTAIHKFCGKASDPLVVTSSENTLTISHQFKIKSWSQNGFLAEWNEVRQDKKNENNYLITYPHTILKNSEDAVCLEVFSNNQERGNGNFTVNIFTRNPMQEEASIVYFENIGAEESTKCLSVNIPKELDISSGILEFVGNFENSDFNIKAFKKINFIKEENFNLIQTDKGQYKPKDIVKFRVLLVNNHLMAANIEMIREIWVEDAAKRRIAQWKNQSLKKGILQQQFELSEEPELGTWKIRFQTTEMIKGMATFIVSEHILPKFEVKIDSPAAVLRDSNNATWKVCGIYTHGGSVIGSVKANFTSLYPIHRAFSTQNEVVTVQIMGKINSGESCVKIVLDRNQLMKITNNGKINGFGINVEFEETGTFTRMASERREYLKDEAFKIIPSSSSSPFILGGYPYIGEFKVMNHDGTPRSEEELEVCARLFRDIADFRFSMWSMDEDEILGLVPKLPKLHFRSQCHRLTTDKDGKFGFFVPLIDIPRDVVKLSVNATAINFPKNETTMMKQPMGKLDVQLTHVNSTLAVLLKEKESLVVSCDNNFTSKVYFANKPGTSFDFYYKIIANGKIFQSNTVNINMASVDTTDELVMDAKLLTTQPNQEDKQTDKIMRSFDISIPIDYRLSPTMNLIIFILDSNSTIVSTSHIYKVQPCQQHKVSGKWSNEKVYPGTPVSYKLEAGSKSVCGLSATDKSVELMGNKNKITGERINQLQSRVNYRKTSYSPQSYAYYRCPKTQQFVNQFARSGISIVSDLAIIGSCQTVTDGLGISAHPVYSYSSGGRSSSPNYFLESDSSMDTRGKVASQDSQFNSDTDFQFDEPSISLRNYFPETWLFDLYEVDDEIELNLTAPHTITEWQAETFCINDEKGLGLSKLQPLLVNQDFFADLNLPYSVKRGEGFPLNITIFNNVDQDLPIRVTIKNNAEEVMMEQNSFDLCISPRSNKMMSIKTTANQLGNVNITVEAQITNGITGCKNVNQGEGFTDALVKPLLVKPEGFPIEKVESEFLCRNEEDSSSTASIKMTPLTLPSNTVQDSERAWVYLTGDIMAPTLQNIDNLVNLPMGCGEQNMARLVPNIYLLQYLAAMKKKEKALEKKARMYINIGFIRQQEYRHDDGSYSIWGKGNGSTWLTAFVLKSFSEAYSLESLKYPWESIQVIQQSVAWLMNGQKEDGCFLMKGYTYSSSLKGGANEDSLTPFVVLSLLQVQENIPTNLEEKKLMNAVDCMLNSFDISKLYSASLTTYVANLLNQKKKLPLKTKEKIQSLWPQILKAANTSVPGALFWDSGSSSSNSFYSHSKAVEITAYNILTMSLLDQLSDAVQSVKWLARQRNSYGGFVSTQDTVVALQALSAYTQKVIAYPFDMSIDIEENNLATSYKITPENALLLQTQKLSKLPGTISVTTSGSGCALVQTVLRYNQQAPKDNNGFSITVENILDKALQICYKYTGSKEKTDMTVMEVELVTGWEAQNLDDLLNDVNNSLRRFEKKEDTVVLYFDEVTGNKECLEMEVKQTIPVDNPNAAIIKMYDYYNSEDTVSIQYPM